MAFTKQLEIDQRTQRSIEWADLYRYGWSLQDIGDEYALTRERVRQILYKAGVRAEEGGGALKNERRFAAKKSKRQAAADARCMRVYGCSAQEVLDCNYGLPLRAKSSMASAYMHQKSNAKARGVEWRMNFAEWHDIWKASGFMQHRGRGIGRYVMARRGDVGPYSPENVYITTGVQNIQDGYEFRRRRTERATRAGLDYRQRNREVAG